MATLIKSVGGSYLMLRALHWWACVQRGVYGRPLAPAPVSDLYYTVSDCDKRD